MAVVFDAKTTDKLVTSPASATITYNSTDAGAITVGVGSNRAIVFLIITAGPAASNITVNSLTWDVGGTNQSAAAITGALHRSNGGANGDYMATLWGLVAPTSGNKTWNCVLNVTTAADVYLAAVSFTGVDQTGGATSFPHGTGAGSTVGAAETMNVTSAVGNQTVAVWIANGSGFTSTSGNQIFIDLNGSSSEGAGNYQTGAPTVTMTVTETTVGTDWAAAGTDVAAAAAGGLPPGAQSFDLTATRATGPGSYPTNLRTWTDTANTLPPLGGAKPVKQTEWPIPLGHEAELRLYGPALRTWIQNANTLPPFGGAKPIHQDDWPLARAFAEQPLYGPTLRTWIHLANTLPPFGGAKPFHQDDWPVPQAPPYTIDKRTWIDEGNNLPPIPVTTVPFNQTDWPVPQAPPPEIQLRTWVQTGPPEISVRPFTQDDWPVPVAPPYAVSLRSWFDTPNTVPPFGGAQPFNQTDWPIPRAAPYSQDLRTTTFSSVALFPTFMPGSATVMDPPTAPQRIDEFWWNGPIQTTALPPGEMVFDRPAQPPPAAIGQTSSFPRVLIGQDARLVGVQVYDRPSLSVPPAAFTWTLDEAPFLSVSLPPGEQYWDRPQLPVPPAVGWAFGESEFLSVLLPTGAQYFDRPPLGAVPAAFGWTLSESVFLSVTLPPGAQFLDRPTVPAPPLFGTTLSSTQFLAAPSAPIGEQIYDRPAQLPSRDYGWFQSYTVDLAASVPVGSQVYDLPRAPRTTEYRSWSASYPLMLISQDAVPVGKQWYDPPPLGSRPSYPPDLRTWAYDNINATAPIVVFPVGRAFTDLPAPRYYPPDLRTFVGRYPLMLISQDAVPPGKRWYDQPPPGSALPYHPVLTWIGRYPLMLIGQDARLVGTQLYDRPPPGSSLPYWPVSSWIWPPFSPSIIPPAPPPPPPPPPVFGNPIVYTITSAPALQYQQDFPGVAPYLSREGQLLYLGNFAGQLVMVAPNTSVRFRFFVDRQVNISQQVMYVTCSLDENNGVDPAASLRLHGPAVAEARAGDRAFPFQLAVRQDAFLLLPNALYVLTFNVVIGPPSQAKTFQVPFFTSAG